jgi:hypothetical protein
VDDETVHLVTEVAKVDSHRRQVFGWASVVQKNGETVTDLQGDEIDAEELEQAVYAFVAEWAGAGVGDMHEGDAVGKVIESAVFTEDKVAKLGLPDDLVGRWWYGVQIDDPDLFAKVMTGERAAFSIQGSGVRIPIEEA